MTLIHFNAYLDLVEVMFSGFKHETTLSFTSIVSLFSGLFSLSVFSSLPSFVFFMHFEVFLFGFFDVVWKYEIW